MASWQEVEREAPELAARARGMFDASVHKTLATIRRDGSPRISGTEVNFRAGELWLGGPGREGARPATRPSVRAAQRVG